MAYHIVAIKVVVRITAIVTAYQVVEGIPVVAIACTVDWAAAFMEPSIAFTEAVGTFMAIPLVVASIAKIVAAEDSLGEVACPFVSTMVIPSSTALASEATSATVEETSPTSPSTPYFATEIIPHHLASIAWATKASTLIIQVGFVHHHRPCLAEQLAVIRSYWATR